MQRINITPRENWQQKLEDLSFKYHSLGAEYWVESKYYQFTMEEILSLEKASNELFQMCLEAVQYVIDNNLYEKLCIHPDLISVIERSWENEEASVYGRFDLGYDGENIKLFEFNADTPTSLYEAAVIQWYWLQDISKESDQFNSIHEKLIDYWKSCTEYFEGKTLYFTCIKDTIEDFTTVQYLRDTAANAGLKTEFIYLDDIGYDYNLNQFQDLNRVHIEHIFKLYPYEWMMNEEYGQYLNNTTRWIEPAWKAILSNKGILAILWEMYPNHPLLLETYFSEPKNMIDYVVKPIYSREGANIEIVSDNKVTDSTEGEYGEEGHIYQQLFNVTTFDNDYPVIGSWIIGGEAAGIGIRESKNKITDNLSCFIPHLIKQ